MSSRYILRFESSERCGESLPLTGPVFTVGRRPGNSLNLNEASVSGRHAELHVAEDGVRVKDLGSTNGTLVDGRRVEEARVGHGARLCFGAIEMTLLESQPGRASFRAAEVVASEPQASEGDGASGGETLAVSAEMVARAGQRSKLAPLLLAAAAVLAGAAWWFSRSGAESGGGPGVATPLGVAGNLLASSYSFEAAEGEHVASGWLEVEGSEASFTPSPSSRHWGSSGLGVTLGPGQFAAHASPTVGVEPGRGLEAVAYLRVEAPLASRVGIELFPPVTGTGGAQTSQNSVIAWSEPAGQGSEFVAQRVRSTVPHGYRRARVLLRVQAPGERASVDSEARTWRLDVDDVSLVQVPAAVSTITSDIFALVPLGDPALSAVLLRGGLPVASEWRVVPASGDSTDGRLPLELTSGEQGPTLALPADTRLRLRLEERGQEGGWATLAAEGYTRRSVDFEAQKVQALLVGEGLELFGLFFDPPLTVSARSEEGIFSIEADASGAPREVVIRTSFADERGRAGELARRAEGAERAGQPGEALRAWDELLRTTPFHSELVQQAETSRATLARQGLEAVRSLSAEYERARFFRLADLFRTTRDAASELATNYAGSEVEAEARSLLAAVEEDLAGLESRLHEHERQRLEAIRAGLEAGGSTRMATEVADYLERLSSGGTR